MKITSKTPIWLVSNERDGSPNISAMTLGAFCLSIKGGTNPDEVTIYTEKSEADQEVSRRRRIHWMVVALQEASDTTLDAIEANLDASRD